EGTILFKELQLTLPGQNPDGSRTEPSGRGYFPGPFNGADVTVKIPSAMPIPTGGATTISIIMSQRLQLPKRNRLTNAPFATSPAPRKMTVGPSSIPCWP